MAEDTEGTTEETGAPAGEKEPATGEADLGDAGKRALEAERKARRVAERRATAAEAKVKEAEDADKTEVERLQGQVTELTRRAGDAESQVARFEVAAAKGLSLAQARRLVGSTKEELETDAEDMRAELGLDKDTSVEDAGKGGTSRALPKENLKAGASNAEDEEPDPGAIADSILKTRW